MIKDCNKLKINMSFHRNTLEFIGHQHMIKPLKKKDILKIYKYIKYQLEYSVYTGYNYLI